MLFSMAALLFAFSQTALARDNGSLNGFRNHALSVLVRVNAQGQVTEVQPSVKLTPRTTRLLRANLDEMIVKPAMIKGHPVSSVFVIQLALHARKKADGTYQAHFSYVTSLPVPPGGTWYWDRINGHRLALVQDQGGSHHRPHRTMRHWQQIYQPFTQQGTTLTPASNQATPALHAAMPTSGSGRPAPPPAH